MVSIGIGAEELDLNLRLDIVLAQVCRSDLNLIPDELFAAKRLLNLRLVYGDPLARAQILIDDEEVEAAGALKFCRRGENDHLGVLLSLHFLSDHGDCLFVAGIFRVF